MMDMAEKIYHIRIRNKLRWQVIKDLSQRTDANALEKYPMSLLCGYLGISGHRDITSMSTVANATR